MLGYGAVSLTSSLAAALGRPPLHAAVKYAIAPTLAANVVAETRWRERESAMRSLTLVAALAGSALGDHFMLAESRATGAANRDHLRRGAAAFAVQQAGLIACMTTGRYRFRARPVKAAAGALAAVAVIDGAAKAREGQLAPPDPIITAYGVLLTAMAALSQGTPEVNTPAAQLVRAGGPIFLLSDAAIITRQLLPTGRARDLADGFVMLTYTAALGLLVEGLRREG